MFFKQTIMNWIAGKYGKKTTGKMSEETMKMIKILEDSLIEGKFTFREIYDPIGGKDNKLSMAAMTRTSVSGKFEKGTLERIKSIFESTKTGLRKFEENAFVFQRFEYKGWVYLRLELGLEHLITHSVTVYSIEIFGKKIQEKT